MNDSNGDLIITNKNFIKLIVYKVQINITTWRATDLISKQLDTIKTKIIKFLYIGNVLHTFTYTSKHMTFNRYINYLSIKYLSVKNNHKWSYEKG